MIKEIIIWSLNLSLIGGLVLLVLRLLIFTLSFFFFKKEEILDFLELNLSLI